MASKTKSTNSANCANCADCILSPADAKQILALYDSIKAADKHFKSCQSDAWRTFVSRNANAPIVAAAFAKLKDGLTALEAETPQQ